MMRGSNIIIIIISLVRRGCSRSDPDRHLALPQEVAVHFDAAILCAVLDGVVLADALRAVDVERLHPCRSVDRTKHMHTCINDEVRMQSMDETTMSGK